jgi:hypothetical protein
VVDDPSRYRCTACGQDPNLGFSHPQNAHFRQLHTSTLAAASSSNSYASGQSHTSSHTPATPQLTKRDKEFERLAVEGPQLQRFAVSSAVSVKDALRTARLSYAATEYTLVSASLLKLVQSGRLTKVGHAIPRLLATANAQTESESVLVLKDGVVGSKDSGSAPPLSSLSDFLAAFCGTIIPALIEQPAALLEWNALARTVVTQ